MTTETLERAKKLRELIETVESNLETVRKCTNIRILPIRAEYSHIQRDVQGSLTKEQLELIKVMLETYLDKNLKELKNEFEKL